ncbi:MAG: hypothetical protein ACRC2K_03430 [Clostridium sp.]
MRSYREYINNLDEFNNIDLINTSGIIKINLGEDSFITYGNSIVRVLITIISQLESGKGTNKKLQRTYLSRGDKSISIDILEVLDEQFLKEKSMEYIEIYKPTLNYQRGENGFTKEHKKKLSQCKKGEKHNRAKLTEKDAKEIKNLSTHTSMTSTEIGSIFNISPGQVRKIRAGIAWRHITL